MKKSWNLANGIDRHNESPESFLIPTDKEKLQLKVGDTIKLIFEFESDEPDVSGAERMWVEITKIEKNILEWRLDNDPYEIKDLKCDDLIIFNYDHIIDIYEKEEYISWLQWWDFLEVSFIQEIKSDKKSFVLDIINTLQQLKYSFEIAIDDHELNEKVNDFSTGYLDDENNPNSTRYHSIDIPIWLNISGRRKARLLIQTISDELIMINTYFYWAEDDVPEWWQIWIKDNELIHFEEYLQDIFQTINFPIWMIAFEDDIIAVFNTNSCWPDKSYNLNNIDRKFINSNMFTIIRNGCVKKRLFWKYIDIENWG